MSETNKNNLDEQARLQSIYAENPELASVSELTFDYEHFKQIGIEYDLKPLGPGWLKYMESDFIVEEIDLEGKLNSVNAGDSIQANDSIGNITEAKLVKKSLSSIEACEAIAAALSIPVEEIGYAGIKDKKAITAQTIMIKRDVADQLASLKLDGILLSSFKKRTTPLLEGQLQGNEFAILVRAEKSATEAILDKTRSIAKGGFYNFYSFQRFGTRLRTHIVGELILKAKYREAVEEILFSLSDYETVHIQNIREEAKKLYSDLEKCKEVFSEFSNYFMFEITLLETLQKMPEKYVLALKAIKSQTRIAVYAYFSYWYNLVLSKKIAEGDVPEKLPLLSNHEESKELYKKYIPKEEFEQFVLDQPYIEFINWNKVLYIETTIKPKINKIVECDAGYLFDFTLGKGAYATTFLANYFNLHQQNKLPDSISTQKIDTLKALGKGSVLDVEGKLGNIQTDQSTAAW